MRIRHADPAQDAAACAQLYAPYVRDTAISFEDRPPDPAEMARRIERISARYPWLVVEVEDHVVGYAYASAHRERAAYRWSAEVTVYLASEHRGRGLGRELYETLFELLERQGLHLALAGVTLPNPASVALHERLGFRLVGVYRQVGWKQEAWHDVAWFERPLSSGQNAPGGQPGPPVRLESS